MNKLKKYKIAYSAHSQNYDSPADRRRFLFYAKKRKLNFDYYNPKNKYDIVILTGSSDLSIIERLIKEKTIIIFDCTDSYYLQNDNWRDYLRGFAKYASGNMEDLYFNYGKRLRYVLKKVNGLSCASNEQKIKLLNFNNNVHSISDYFNNETIFLKSDYSNDDVFNIAWEGLPSNVYQLNMLKNVFKYFSKTHSFILHIITDKYNYKYMNKFGKNLTIKNLNGLCENIVLHEWDLRTYSKNLIKCDFAVIPINYKSRFAMAKPENKLIFFWKMGVPTITYATESYKNVMDDAEINLYCINDFEWIDKFNYLASKSSKREEIALKALKYVNKNYNEDSILEKWDKLSLSVLS